MTGFINFTACYWAHTTYNVSGDHMAYLGENSEGASTTLGKIINSTTIDVAYHSDATSPRIQLTQPIINNTWNHFCLVQTAKNNTDYYVNGVHYGLIDRHSRDLSLTSSKIEIHIYSGDVGSTFKGNIDEFGLWNTSLNTTQISSLYNYGLGNPYPFTHDISPNGIVLVDINNLSIMNNVCGRFQRGIITVDECNTTGIILNAPDNGTWNITYPLRNDYYNTTVLNVDVALNKTHYAHQALLTPLFYGVNGQIINGSNNFTLQNNKYTTQGLASQFTIYARNGSNTLNYNNIRYWPGNTNCQATSTLNAYCSINDVSNAYIRFLGFNGASEYYPVCTVNNTAFLGNGRYYTVYENTTLIECPDTAYTQAKNITLSWNASGPINNTITLSEWALSLNFTANTTGNISWTLPNEAGECCSWKLQNTTYYNISSFKLLVAKSKFGDDDVVTVRYNNQLNNTLTQYYQFINNAESMQSDKVCVHNMTGIVYLDLLNEGRDFLDGATIRTEYYADNNMSNYCVAGQYISAAERGTALPGVPVQYNYQYDYRLIITKDGYTPYITTLSGYDLENGGVIEMHMKRALSTMSDGTSIACVQYYDNTTTQLGVGVGTTYNDAILYYNTTFNAALRTVANNNGVGYALQKGTDFAQGSDVTTHVYRYNATTDTYIELAQCNIQYLSRNFTGVDIQPPQDFIDNNNGVVSTILFVIVIILSSIVGFTFNKDGNDTGYYVFSALTVGLAFAFTWFILPAAIITLGAVGTYLMRSTEN